MQFLISKVCVCVHSYENYILHLQVHFFDDVNKKIAFAPHILLCMHVLFYNNNDNILFYKSLIV